MLDLFEKPKNAKAPALAQRLEESSEKILSNEPRATPPPKIFEASVGNSDRLVEGTKNHFDPCNSLQAEKESKTPISYELETSTVDSEEAPKKPKRRRIKRISAMVKPPKEEALIAEGVIVEAEDDPRRTDKWSPRWSPRVGHPTKRGWEANINAVHLLESKTQVPKPDIIDWKGNGVSMKDFPWGKAEKDILKFVAAGGTVSSYCQASGLSYMTVRSHIQRNPTFKAQVAEAREAGADALAAEALNIASTPCLTEERITVYDKNDQIVTKSVKLADNTYARKLAFQARMQLLEKWAPDKYGPNAKAEVSGGMAEKLRAARERIRSDMRAARKPSGKKPDSKT